MSTMATGTFPDLKQVINGQVVACPLNVNGTPDAIRDTNPHDPSGDTGLQLAQVMFLPGEKTLFVNNTTNQSLTVKLCASPDTASGDLVTFTSTATVAAGTVAFIDASTIAQLAKPYPYMGVSLSFGVAPASGGVLATLYAKSS